MASVLYEGSPLDEYFKASAIDEVSEVARKDEVDEPVAAPGGWTEPPSSGSSSRSWEEACWKIVECLPIDLIHLLGLSPITLKRTSLTDRYKYLICSSSLLDSTLSRATDQETASTSTDPSEPLSPCSSSSANLSDLDTNPSTPPNPHKLVVLGCIPLLSLILPLSPLWRSLLFLLLGLLALSLSLLVKVAPSINMEGYVDGPDGSASSQRKAVESMKKLVCEAEALDRCVNAVLLRVSSTDKSSSSATRESDVSFLPFSPLRQSLLSSFIFLTSLSNATTQTLLPLASPFELTILSSMYGLASANVPLPPSPAHSAASSGLRPFASSPHAKHAKRMSVPSRPNFNRFVSPPRSRETSGSSTIPSLGGESGESPTPTTFTALPPRTPRTNKRQTWTPSTRGTSTGLRSPPQPNFSSLLPTPGSPRPSSLLPSLLSDTSSSSPPPPSPSFSLRRTPSLDLETTGPPSQLRKRFSHQGLLYAPQLSLDTPTRKPRSPLTVAPPSPTLYSLSLARSRRISAPSQPRPLVESESEWESEAGLEDAMTLPTASLVRTTSHPLPRRQRPTSLIYRPSFNHQATPSLSSPFLDTPSRTPPFLLSEADEDEHPDTEPTPLSHLHLLSAFLTLHTRRRHTLVSLLALRRDSTPEYWEKVRGAVVALLEGFRDVRLELLREISLSKLGGGDGWAPRAKSQAEQRREVVASLQVEVGRLGGRLAGLVAASGEEEEWEDVWEGLREDLGGLVRVWERGRDAKQLGGKRREPRAMADRNFDIVLDPSTLPVDTSLTEDRPEFEDAPEDDVTLHLLSQTQLPPIGREELFAGETTRLPLVRPPIIVSREERIRLARLEREEKAAHEAEQQHNGRSGPGGKAGMGDVVTELKGLMGELRRRKGPIGAAFDEEEEEEEEEEQQPAKDASFTTPPQASSPRFPSTAPSAYAFVLPPPPNRSSLPALSSGSSDGDGEMMGSEEEVEFGGEGEAQREGLGCGGSESTLGGEEKEGVCPEV